MTANPANNKEPTIKSPWYGRSSPERRRLINLAMAGHGIEFREMWTTGVRMAKIRERFGITDYDARVYASMLGLEPRTMNGARNNGRSHVVEQPNLVPFRLSDADVERIADAVIAKLDARGVEGEK